MHAHAHNTRICPTCDGFPIAHVSIGSRQTDGTLPTLPVVCLHCAGTGLVPAVDKTPALAPAGR